MKEEHIINQMLKEEETPVNFFDRVNFLYDKYLNTLNNETKKYLNMEDERTGMDKKYLFTSELGLNIYDNPILRVGSCEREIYFKIFPFTGLSKTFKDVESIEKDELVKNQWLRKLKLAGVIVDIEQGSVKDLHGIKLKSSIDTFIYNFNNNEVAGLLIKPVNDTAKSIRNQLWSDYDNVKPTPLRVHLPEVLSLLIFYKLPIKILYVGKNNSGLMREFTFGIKDKCLTIDGEKVEGITVDGIAKSLGILRKAIEEKVVPPRAYPRPRILTTTEIGSLVKEKLINKVESDRLVKGDEFKSFKCLSCKYREICDSLEDGFVSINL
ncbi:hypothetical protein [Cetobacterium sp.]|uniref:hypothetical protein n=1 Tax=Cetobacterium sp. TaxID=2071632 RepID=UPI003F2A7C0A